MAIPLKDTTTESVIDAFSHGWVSTYGIPQAITTDRGSQFTSAVWKQLLRTWGITNLQTTAYHPEANGLVERLHRRLKESLMALCAQSPENWFWKLPMALLAIRTTLKPDVGSSPADMVFGEGLALPGELLLPSNVNDADLQRQREASLANLRLEVARLQPTPTSAHRQPRVYLPSTLDTASHVFVRRGGVQPSLASPYEGPFRVAERTAAGFRVHLPGGRIETIALARLKPAHIAADNVKEMQPQDLNDARPPSPPPPDRPPGVRTRQPQPTDRSTRQNSRRRQQDRQSQARPEASASTSSFRRPQTPAPSTAPETPPAAPMTPAAPREEDRNEPTAFFNDGLVDATKTLSKLPPSDVVQTARRPRFFSNPVPGNFSYRRRPDVNAITAMVRDHLQLEPASGAIQADEPISSSHRLGGCRLKALEKEYHPLFFCLVLIWMRRRVPSIGATCYYS